MAVGGSSIGVNVAGTGAGFWQAASNIANRTNKQTFFIAPHFWQGTTCIPTGCADTYSN
jgi:hypothetical protein